MGATNSNPNTQSPSMGGSPRPMPYQAQGGTQWMPDPALMQNFAQRGFGGVTIADVVRSVGAQQATPVNQAINTYNQQPIGFGSTMSGRTK